jgi:hypothetical protein
MAEPPEMDALARRFLALWQDQLVATASDPELAAALTRMMTLTGAALAPWTAAMQAAVRRRDVDEAAPPDAADAPERPAAADAPERPAAAPAASGDGGDALAELARRLAALEERLALLEAGAGGGRARPRERARRRRP